MRHSVSDLTAVIRDRRTIYPKDMSDRVVQRDMVELILSNGTWAPNHGMTQPWRFTVFASDARQRLSAFMGEEYTRITPPEKFMPRKHENAVQRPLQASVVVALGMARVPRGTISELEEQLAVACAVQNMHLTCTAYGLGGFWGTGAVVTGDGMRRFLGLAEGDRCMGLFYIGYPAAEWPKGYRKPLPDVLNWMET